MFSSLPRYPSPPSRYLSLKSGISVLCEVHACQVSSKTTRSTSGGAGLLQNQVDRALDLSCYCDIYSTAALRGKVFFVSNPNPCRNACAALQRARNPTGPPFFLYRNPLLWFPGTIQSEAPPYRQAYGGFWLEGPPASSLGQSGLPPVAQRTQKQLEHTLLI